MAVNVVGILPGELADSAIVVDAHYDHNGVTGRGMCRAVGADSVCNGADDDASGTVAVIEIAKALAAGPKPHRTIIFAATTGEEVGLIGTRWYIAHPVVPLANMTANLEIEMIDRPDSLAGGPGHAWLTGFDRSTMGDMFKKAGLPVEPDKRVCEGFFERSDNIAFARAGHSGAHVVDLRSARGLPHGERRIVARQHSAHDHRDSSRRPRRGHAREWHVAAVARRNEATGERSRSDAGAMLEVTFVSLRPPRSASSATGNINVAHSSYIAARRMQPIARDEIVLCRRAARHRGDVDVARTGALRLLTTDRVERVDLRRRCARGRVRVRTA